MGFIWPQSLWLVLLVPALVAGYRRIEKRRTELAKRHPGLVPARRGAMRHLPPAMFVLAVVLLLAASARPTALVVMPAEARVVILAIDVSGSMGADDVAPSRLAAAKAAARAFVRSVPSTVKIGVVAFSDLAFIVQPPVTAREDALYAIDSLHPENGTAIGSGIVAALNAIDPDAHYSLDTVVSVPQPPATHADASSAIILLTDGQNTYGPDPMDAARLAAGRGTRIYTVGVGTPYGQIRDSIGTRASVGVDEEAMRGVAKLTGADYYYATSALDLSEVYQQLGASVVLARIRTEITAPLCALAALLATVSAGFSLVWFGRVL